MVKQTLKEAVVGSQTLSTLTFTNILIFNDGFVFLIASIGAFLSWLNLMLTLSNVEFKHEGKKLTWLNLFLKGIKAIIFGAGAILLVFFSLKVLGTDYVLKLIHIDSSLIATNDVRIIDTIFLIFSSLISWLVMPIMSVLEKRIK